MTIDLAPAIAQFMFENPQGIKDAAERLAAAAKLWPSASRDEVLRGVSIASGEFKARAAEHHAQADALERGDMSALSHAEWEEIRAELRGK